MQLILQNGYPFPHPEGLTEQEEEDISTAAPGNRLILEGVTAFEMKHTLTVEFRDDEHFDKAQEATGWKTWSYRVLEGKTSSEDGYQYDAIIARDVAYCGFIVAEG